MPRWRQQQHPEEPHAGGVQGAEEPGHRNGPSNGHVVPFPAGQAHEIVLVVVGRQVSQSQQRSDLYEICVRLDMLFYSYSVPRGHFFVSLFYSRWTIVRHHYWRREYLRTSIRICTRALNSSSQSESTCHRTRKMSLLYLAIDSNIQHKISATTRQ